MQLNSYRESNSRSAADRTKTAVCALPLTHALFFTPILILSAHLRLGLSSWLPLRHVVVAAVRLRPSVSSLLLLLWRHSAWDWCSRSACEGRNVAPASGRDWRETRQQCTSVFPAGPGSNSDKAVIALRAAFTRDKWVKNRYCGGHRERRVQRPPWNCELNLFWALRLIWSLHACACAWVCVCKCEGRVLQAECAVSWTQAATSLSAWQRSSSLPNGRAPRLSACRAMAVYSRHNIVTSRCRSRKFPACSQQHFLKP
jgi:hypothetical protein